MSNNAKMLRAFTVAYSAESDIGNEFTDVSMTIYATYIASNGGNSFMADGVVVNVSGVIISITPVETTQ